MKKLNLFVLCLFVSVSAKALDRDYICDQSLSGMIDTISTYQKALAICSDPSTSRDVYQSAQELARQAEELYDSQKDNCRRFCTRVPNSCSNDRGLSGACP